ncbi:MAG: GvpL/GvpF family gas vesicle protein [Candidatus Schekmanbacteria bacterium]|nr:GvpL/GvpF family gas vesicle protein [Candidatus Schekmanbacteria bacterium]
MNYLLYCVFSTLDEPGKAAVLGVGGEPVFYIAHGGLSAAVSQINSQEAIPDIPRICAYNQVVTYFHNNRAVIPMRYGSLFAQEAQVVRFLEAHSEQFKSLIQKLTGCEEMGIRLLLPNAPRVKKENPRSETTYSSGHAYLAAKRQHYQQEEPLAHERDLLVKTVCHKLSEFFVHSKQEFCVSEDKRIISLYFLVPGNSVERFCHAARQIKLQASGELLLSGPWPPYNFVQI